jgi:hypothetical protein
MAFAAIVRRPNGCFAAVALLLAFFSPFDASHASSKASRSFAGTWTGMVTGKCTDGTGFRMPFTIRISESEDTVWTTWNEWKGRPFQSSCRRRGNELTWSFHKPGRGPEKWDISCRLRLKGKNFAAFTQDSLVAMGGSCHGTGLLTKGEAAPTRSAGSKKTARGRTFSGTWNGNITFGIAGTFNLTLVVNSEGNLVMESGGLVNGSHPAVRTGDMISWRSGSFNEVEWTLKPSANGSSATVTAKSPPGVRDTATFHKQSSSVAPATSSLVSRSTISSTTSRPNRSFAGTWTGTASGACTDGSTGSFRYTVRVSKNENSISTSWTGMTGPPVESDCRKEGDALRWTFQVEDDSSRRYTATCSLAVTGRDTAAYTADIVVTQGATAGYTCRLAGAFRK